MKKLDLIKEVDIEFRKQGWYNKTVKYTKEELIALLSKYIEVEETHVCDNQLTIFPLEDDFIFFPDNK